MGWRGAVSAQRACSQLVTGGGSNLGLGSQKVGIY